MLWVLETTSANRSFAPSPAGRQCLGAERGMLTGLILSSNACIIKAKAHVVSVYNLQSVAWFVVAQLPDMWHTFVTETQVTVAVMLMTVMYLPLFSGWVSMPVGRRPCCLLHAGFVVLRCILSSKLPCAPFQWIGKSGIVSQSMWFSRSFQHILLSIKPNLSNLRKISNSKPSETCNNNMPNALMSRD